MIVVVVVVLVLYYSSKSKTTSTAWVPEIQPSDLDWSYVEALVAAGCGGIDSMLVLVQSQHEFASDAKSMAPTMLP